MQLSGEIAAVANPDGMRAGSQRGADLETFEIVLDRLTPHRGIAMTETAELVRQRLSGAILKRIRVDRVDGEPACLRVRPQLAGIPGCVPWDMKGYARSGAREPEHHLAIVELLEHIPRLAGNRKAREPRAARSQAPRWHGHVERHEARDERLGIHTPASELPGEVFVILLERRREGGICFLNKRFADQNPVVHKALYHTVGVTQTSYLAFDLGAESGRAVLARLEGGLVRIDEIHRFANTPLSEAGTLRWDVQALWCEMRHALSLTGDTALSGIAVDSWGVDFALLSAEGELLENPYHYRDARNAAAMADALAIVPREEIY